MGVCLVLSRGGGIVTQCQSFVLPQDGSDVTDEASDESLEDSSDGLSTSAYAERVPTDIPTDSSTNFC